MLNLSPTSPSARQPLRMCRVFYDGPPSLHGPSRRLCGNCRWPPSRAGLVMLLHFFTSHPMFYGFKMVQFLGSNFPFFWGRIYYWDDQVLEVMSIGSWGARKSSKIVWTAHPPFKDTPMQVSTWLLAVLRTQLIRCVILGNWQPMNPNNPEPLLLVDGIMSL